MNDRDWFRKGMKNRRPGCVLGLPLGLLALVSRVVRRAVTRRLTGPALENGGPRAR